MLSLGEGGGGGARGLAVVCLPLTASIFHHWEHQWRRALWRADLGVCGGGGGPKDGCAAQPFDIPLPATPTCFFGGPR